MSVGTAALIVGILTSFSDPKSSAGALIRMVAGLFLALVAIKPLTNLNFDVLESFVQSYSEAGQSIAASGQAAAEKVMAAYIKEEAEAYILDKASLYGAELEVDIEMGTGEMPIPESIRIQGSISPYGRMQLQRLLTEEFGIPKEQQIWIG